MDYKRFSNCLFITQTLKCRHDFLKCHHAARIFFHLFSLPNLQIKRR
nr:MAG TPA: hypothetical protein [Caudoviricetes sp.]